jgi:hypothetical protein
MFIRGDVAVHGLLGYEYDILRTLRIYAKSVEFVDFYASTNSSISMPTHPTRMKSGKQFRRLFYNQCQISWYKSAYKDKGSAPMEGDLVEGLFYNTWEKR